VFDNPSFDCLDYLSGASHKGAAVVTLTKVMPKHVRTVGFSLVYSLVTAIFGGNEGPFAEWP
jgi:MHS family citrate/tricarballylate:H+ symporter-like MFS transporter